jgi:hypothetical protein
MLLQYDCERGIFVEGRMVVRCMNPPQRNGIRNTGRVRDEAIIVVAPSTGTRRRMSAHPLACSNRTPVEVTTTY